MTGETVNVKNGDIYVNDKKLKENYCNTDTYVSDKNVKYPITVNKNCVFVLGDNRPNAIDSRDPEIGQVSIDSIKGEIQMTIWALETAKKVNDNRFTRFCVKVYNFIKNIQH